MTTIGRRSPSRSTPPLRGERLIRLFERIKAERGLPDRLRVDNGPELIGDAFSEWIRDNGVLVDYIEPGKPNQNAFIERFNRTYVSAK